MLLSYLCVRSHFGVSALSINLHSLSSSLVHRFGSSHLTELFGAKGDGVSAAEKAAAIAAAKANRHASPRGEPSSFTSEATNAMFKSLDVNCDGYVCAKDLHLWLSEMQDTTGCASSTSMSESTESILKADEVAAFLQCGQILDDQGSSTNFGSNPTVEAIGSGDKFNEEGLASCLVRFPMLAFDWNAPLGVIVSGSDYGHSDNSSTFQGRAISRDAAAKLFQRLDTDGDGWVRAADLRVWRRMLPLGRSEEALVHKMLANARKAASEKAAATRRNSIDVPGMQAAANKPLRRGSLQASPEEALGIKPWDFYTLLRDDPTLTAELSAQAALLDFIVRGDHVNDNQDPEREAHGSSARAASNARGDTNATFAGLSSEGSGFGNLFDFLDFADVRDMHGSVARSSERTSPDASRSANNVPSDSMVSAFVCVAKLKLRRLAQVQRAAEAEEDSVAAAVLRALDASGSGFVSAHDVQKYLQEHADLMCLSVEDVNLFMGDFILQNDDDETDESAISDDEGGCGGVGRLLDQAALRELLSEPAHRNLTSALHRFVQVQQQLVARKESTAPQKPLFSAAGVTQKKLLRGFGKAALQVWFEELDLNRDGYVTARDVSFWCATASCQSLVDEADLESLFHPSLPDFSGPPASGSRPPTVLRSAVDLMASPSELSSTRLPKLSALVDGDLFGEGQEVTFDGSDDEETKDEKCQLRQQHIAMPRPAAVVSAASPRNVKQDEVPPQMQRTKILTDEKYASLIEAVQSTSPVRGGLTKAALATALARRPLLAARLALMHRMNRAMQATLLAEASATSALSAAANATTTAVWAATITEGTPEHDRAVIMVENATLAADRAAAQAAEAGAAALAACSTGKNLRSGRINLFEDAAVRDLEIQVVQAGEPYSQAAAATRRALHAQRAKGWQRSFAVLSMEVALEVKLLAWREAEHYPQQVQELRVLLPLRSAAATAGIEDEAFALEALVEQDDEEIAVKSDGEEEKKTVKVNAKNQGVPSRRASFREKLSGAIRGHNGHLAKLEDEMKKDGKQAFSSSCNDAQAGCGIETNDDEAPAAEVHSRVAARKAQNTKRAPPLPRARKMRPTASWNQAVSSSVPASNSIDHPDNSSDSDSDSSSEALSSSSSSSASEDEEESSSESSSDEEEAGGEALQTTKKAAPVKVQPRAATSPSSHSRTRSPRKPPPRPVASRDRQVSNRPKPASQTPQEHHACDELNGDPRHVAL